MHNNLADFALQKLLLEDKNFPSLLREIANPPKVLFCKGILPTEEKPSIAIVGTRKATQEGIKIAHQISKDLAYRGFVIVSGLALGIDAAAHKGAISAKGKTIAVLANGLDRIYPRQHENLANEIVKDNGTVISEYPIGTPSYPCQFLERNRIIAGLSIASIIIEAPITSGALVTAKYSCEAGREVFVLPGSSKHPNYTGSHMLIRNGARLVTNSQDILEDLDEIIQNYPLFTEKFNPKTAKDAIIINLEDENQKNIFSILQNSPNFLSIDNISEITKLEAHIVSQALTFLVLNGLIEENNGKFNVKNESHYRRIAY